MRFSSQEIGALKEFRTENKKLANKFYDNGYQPKEEKKRLFEEDYRGFANPLFALFCSDAQILGGGSDRAAKNLEKAGYTQAMYYEPGSTSLTLIVKHGKDEHENWHLMRAWTRNAGYRSGERDKSPLVLQPCEKINMHGDAPPLEVLNFGAIKDAPRNMIWPLSVYMKAAGVTCQLLTDLFILPNGQFLFADPGHAWMSSREDGLERIKAATAEYREAVKDHTDIIDLFDFIQPDGSWVQDKFFPGRLTV